MFNAIDLLNAIQLEDAIRACAGTIRDTWRKELPDKTDDEIRIIKLAECKVSPDEKGAPTTLEQLTLMAAKNFVRDTLQKKKKT